MRSRKSLEVFGCRAWLDASGMAKTPEGKLRSSRNAVKHGLLSKWLTPDELRHSRAVFEALIDELQPEGALQTVLAERAAWLAVRLRTANIEALEAEAAERTEAMSVLSFEERGKKIVTTRAQGRARDLSLIARYEASLQRQFFKVLEMYGKVASVEVKKRVGF